MNRQDPRPSRIDWLIVLLPLDLLSAICFADNASSDDEEDKSFFCARFLVVGRGAHVTL